MMGKVTDADGNKRRLRRSIGLLTVITDVVLGLGGDTFLDAGGFSYLSSDPTVCVNCHIMQLQYDS